MKTNCLLCRDPVNPDYGFYNINQSTAHSSKKTIKNILTHLSKCIKTDCDFDDGSSVCQSCYQKLVEYDQLMIQLLMFQKDLSKMLEESLKFQNEPDEVFDLIEIDEVSATECSADDDDDNKNNVQQDCTENAFSEDPSRSFECNICDKNLKTKHSLRNHMETHSKEVKCTICGALCKDDEYLELHMNLHEGKTEYDCRYCPKRYSRRANVIRHMQVHWDKKKFQCEKCGLRFSQGNILYNHKMIHEAEEQPLICSICDQAFKSKKTFRHHMITHQEDRPMHRCEMCGKKFTERYTLKMHLKTHFRLCIYTAYSTIMEHHFLVLNQVAMRRAEIANWCEYRISTDNKSLLNTGTISVRVLVSTIQS